MHPVRSGRGDDRDRRAAGAGRLDQLPGARHGARRLVRHVLEHLGEHGLGVEPVPGAGLGREDVDRPAAGEDGEVGELPALVGEERLVAAPVQRLGVDQRPVEVEQECGDPRRRPRHAVAKSTSPAATDPPTASLVTDPFGASISTTGTIGETSWPLAVGGSEDGSHVIIGSPAATSLPWVARTSKPSPLEADGVDAEVHEDADAVAEDDEGVRAGP